MNMHRRTDRLTAFLYLLTRDHVASGVIEKLLVTVEELREPATVYSCPHVASLAAEWTERLRPQTQVRSVIASPDPETIAEIEAEYEKTQAKLVAQFKRARAKILPKPPPNETLRETKRPPL